MNIIKLCSSLASLVVAPTRQHAKQLVVRGEKEIRDYEIMLMIMIMEIMMDLEKLGSAECEVANFHQLHDNL